MKEPVRVSLFHDVLCAYCCVAASRIQKLQEEFGDLVALDLRPYPLRVEPAAPSDRDVRRQVRLVKNARREPEGAGMSPALWRGIDPPHSSLPPLLALEAARRQGSLAQLALLERLREAAFRGGVNVARRDVLLEAAASSGLDMELFEVAFDAPETRRAVEDCRREAVAHGVHAIPAVVIGEDWMLTGVRDLGEYRDAILRWLQRSRRTPVRVLN